MVETEERIRNLEQRLAQAEARIAQLEAHPRGVFLPPVGPITGGRPGTTGAPIPDRGFAVSATTDGYVVGRYGPGEP